MSNWQRIGNFLPQELAKPLPDYSHTSLEWNPTLKMFTGVLIETPTPFRVAVDPIALTLLVLNQQNDPIAAFLLHRKTMTEGLNWLKEQMSKLGANPNKIFLPSYPLNDFPNHF